MTELVGPDQKFGDMVLEEEFSYEGKVWRSFLLVPQEHLEDLFRTEGAIRPSEAYGKAPEFWERISQLTRDFYKAYLETQSLAHVGSRRRQWFEWEDFDHLEEAYSIYTSQTNRPLRLSIVAREPLH